MVLSLACAMRASRRRCIRRCSAATSRSHASWSALILTLTLTRIRFTLNPDPGPDPDPTLTLSLACKLLRVLDALSTLSNPSPNPVT